MKQLFIIILAYLVVLAQNEIESLGFTNPDDISLINRYELSEYAYKNLSLKFSGNAKISSDKRYSPINYDEKKYYYYTSSIFSSVNFSENLLTNFIINNNFYQSNVSTIDDPYIWYNRLVFRDYNRKNKNNNLQLVFNRKKYSKINTNIEFNLKHDYEDFYSVYNNNYYKYNSSSKNYDILDDKYCDEESLIHRKINLNLFLSIGIGKIRNLNPLINALRLNERYQAITGKVLSESEILKLSEIINQRSTFTNKYDRSAKYFFPTLFESSENLNSLNYGEKKYLEETFLEDEISRFEGIETDIGILINHSKKSPSLKTTYNSDYSYYDQFKYDTEINNFGPQIVVNYYKNISLYSQFNIKYSGAYLLTNIVTQNTSNSSLLQNLSLSYLYNFTDRLIFNNSINFYNAQNKIKSKDTQTIFETNFVIFKTFFNSQLTYYIENNISLNFDANFYERNDNGFFERSDQFTFGMSYYLFRE